MAAVTVCSDFGVQENKVCHCFHFFSPFICHKVMGPDAMIFVLWMLSFKLAFSLSFFTFMKRLFSSHLLSGIRIVSSACLMLLIFLLAISIQASASSSLAFHMMYSAYKLNKQSDYLQLLCTPFQFWASPLFHVCFLTCTQVSQEAGKVRWSDIPVSLRIFHSLLWSTQSKVLV